jgi:hypothetical protein
MTDQPPREPAGDDADEAEEALSWDTGISDASYVEGPKPARVKKRAVAEPADALEPEDASGPADAREPVDETTREEAPTSSILLVTYGIIAGIFVLYAIGWFTTVRRSSYIDPTALGAVMSVLGEILAVAAAPVWFGGVFVLTRNSKPLTRLLWLLLGLVLLVPIPFLLGV